MYVCAWMHVQMCMCIYVSMCIFECIPPFDGHSIFIIFSYDSSAKSSKPSWPRPL